MRANILTLLLALSACGGTDPGPPRDDDDDGGGPPPLPPSLELVRPKNDGSGQVGTVARVMPQALVVRVVNNGEPFPGIFVTWEGVSPGTQLDPAVSRSDAYGYASSYFRASSVAGLQYGKARLGDQEELFFVDAVAAEPRRLVRVSTVDSVQAGGFLMLRAEVTDVYGNGVTDIPTIWTFVGGPFDLVSYSDSTSNGSTYFAIWFGPTPTSADVTLSVPALNGVSPLIFQVNSY